MEKAVELPNSKESEMMVLGCMLTNVHALNIASELLQVQDFYETAHQTIFYSLKEAKRTGKPGDIHLVAEDLKRQNELDKIGGIPFLIYLAQFAGTSAYIEAYIADVRNIAGLRRLANVGQKISKLALSPPNNIPVALDRAEEMLANLRAENSIKAAGLKFLSELPIDYLEVDAPQKPRLMYWTEDDGTKMTLIHKEIVAMLIGAGGVGKTHLLAHLAICIATGIPFLDKFEFDSPGHVCLVLGENNENDLHRLLRKSRLWAEDLLVKNKLKREHEQFVLHSPDPFCSASSRIAAYSVQGLDVRFIQPDGHPTQFFKNFKAELKSKEPASGWQLIILDPLSRFAGTDTENDNGLATSFIALLEDMILTLKGTPTILLSHHKPKGAVSSAETDQTAARGSSALTDGCRWQANLDQSKEEPNVISVLGLVKSNFTSFPPRIRLRKSKEGCPRFEDFEKKPREKKK